MNKECDLGFAKLDISRKERVGQNETVFCAGKTCEQLVKIFQNFYQSGLAVLGTRCSEEQAEALKKAGLEIKYNQIGKTVILNEKEFSKNEENFEKKILGKVALCSAGTSDQTVFEEAFETLNFLDVEVESFNDIGVAGLHRLLNKLDAIRKADVAIVMAGMDGALVSVMAGLISIPIIAVPTSVGYGASFSGVSALLAMLNSCADGVMVVNIDNGYGAAVAAARILRTFKD